MTERRASEGTVSSTEFLSLSDDSLSIMGGRMEGGTLPTRGPRLREEQSEIPKARGGGGGVAAYHLMARFWTSLFWSSSVLTTLSTARAATL